MVDANCEDQFTIDPSGNKKVILSVDGGGMRGAISIAMLAELEEQTGKSCNEMFDMVVGTSTGAIIAIGLAIGYSATYLLEEVYMKRLPRAFRDSEPGWFTRTLAKLLNGVVPLGEAFLTGILSNGFRYAYALEPFNQQLVPLLQEKGVCKVGELNYPDNPILLVTTKDVVTSETYFIVNAGKGKKYFQDWPLTGAVGGSGAAPLFFPPVAKRLVDGGVGVYSNPCLAAAVEAMEYIGKVPTDAPEYDAHLAGFRDGNVILVSLGTGYVPSILTGAEEKKAWEWAHYVILENLDDAALQQVFLTRAVYGQTPDGSGGRIDFRRYNPLLTAESVSGELDIDLAGRPDPVHLGLDSFKDDEVRLMIDIGHRYAERICWSKPGVMPWETTGGHHRPNPRAVFEQNIQNNPVEWQDTPYACK